MKADCIFCRIVDGRLATDIIDQDETTVTFLDQSPVFPGHLLVVPRAHVDDFTQLAPDRLQPFFHQVQRAARAVEAGLGAEGSFVAINNKISQTVPHLHAHIIPRRKGDGMKGFFWPRRRYADDAHRLDVVDKLRGAFRAL